MKRVRAFLVTWWRRSRIANLEWLCPGEIDNSMPFSEHQLLTFSDDQARCSSTWRTFMGPNDRIHPFSTLLMNSSESSVASRRAEINLVIESDIIRIGTARMLPGGTTHKVSACTRSLKVVVFGMDAVSGMVSLGCRRSRQRCRAPKVPAWPTPRSATNVGWANQEVQSTRSQHTKFGIAASKSNPFGRGCVTRSQGSTFHMWAQVPWTIVVIWIRDLCMLMSSCSTCIVCNAIHTSHFDHISFLVGFSAPQPRDEPKKLKFSLKKPVEFWRIVAFLLLRHVEIGCFQK